MRRSYIYGEVMSKKAVSVLEQYHIPYSYGSLSVIKTAAATAYVRWSSSAWI
jgi:hypothetical protein